MDRNEMLELAVKASVSAGDEILNIYNSNDFGLSIKKDNSPLTIADSLSHARIVKILSDTKLPVLSEEGKEIDFNERKNWEKFWLIDPLDGTKEFIKRNDEFTVNIALIENNTPVMGVIYVPVTKELYFGEKELGSYKLTKYRAQISIDSLINSSDKLSGDKRNKNYVLVVSRSHMNRETAEFVEATKKLHGDIEMLSRGSSLKICMVAEGQADTYPRFAPTMEWDTAAGHAIAKYAGKGLVRTDTGEELIYNKEDLLNPYFIVK